MDISLDAFSELLEHVSDIKDATIRVIESPTNSESVLRITSNVSLTFDQDTDFSCKNIVISDCEVEMSGLTMSGSIVVNNATLKLTNSRVHNPAADSDYILEVTKHSLVSIYDSSLGDTEHFGISVDEVSSLVMERCSVRNCEFFAVAVTGFSLCNCTECVFSDTRNDIIYVDGESSLSLARCTLSRSERLGISSGYRCSMALDTCTFTNCKSGCISASRSERVFMDSCHFDDTPHSSVLLEDTTAMIKKTVISRCNGNAINASHGTKVIVSKCTLKNTTYPPLALCDGTIGYIKKCTVADSDMSGIIIRNRSRAVITKCTVENVKQSGIVASDSQEISVSDTFIVNCQESSLMVYNHSEVHLRSSFLIGPCKVGVDIFTGGFVYSTDTTIAGMRDACVWLHHGGTARFAAALMHTAYYQTRSEVIEKIKSISLSDVCELHEESLFRIETSRPFVASGCFVIGHGTYELEMNTDADEALPGEFAEPAKCKVCGEPAKDCFYSFCGHCLYCRKCWDALETKPERCELCQMPIEKVASPISCSHEDNDAICGVCMSNETDTIIVPCGHMICSECARTWFEEHCECPYCRESYCKDRKMVSYS